MQLKYPTILICVLRSKWNNSRLKSRSSIPRFDTPLIKITCWRPLIQRYDVFAYPQSFRNFTLISTFSACLVNTRVNTFSAVRKLPKMSYDKYFHIGNFYPIDTGRRLNVHKTFRRRPGCLLNILCTFNLRPVSTG